MSAYGFIFARGGSKGLLNKNLKDFCGKPLIAWSIEQALSIKSIKRVIVSTDSIEIADISKRYGAEVPFIRPPELATDESPEWLSWQHALNYISEKDKYLPDFMVSIPSTSPLRSSSDVEKCLDLIRDNENTDVVITVTEASRNPYFNIVTYKKDGYVDLFVPNNNISRRQDAPSVFDITTVAYVARSEFVLNNSSIFEGNVSAVEVSKDSSIDIDTQIDFDIAEFLFKKRKING